MGGRTSMVSQKNATVINITQSRVQSRVLIYYLCTISEFQNTGQSQRISPWDVILACFREKTR
ncbi:hypothetical protein BHE74_00039449 [Ensete ventricosum]|nr:hypothetical protein BHE74_00039449 [Ensete ventricosum]